MGQGVRTLRVRVRGLVQGVGQGYRRETGGVVQGRAHAFSLLCALGEGRTVGAAGGVGLATATLIGSALLPR